jgi:hypothetical protein
VIATNPNTSSPVVVVVFDHELCFIYLPLQMLVGIMSKVLRIHPGCRMAYSQGNECIPLLIGAREVGWGVIT